MGYLRQKTRRAEDLSLRISTRLLRPPAWALLRSADAVRSWDWLWQPTYGRRWQERFYHDRTDPYGCAINPYEKSKYDHTLRLLVGRRYECALEIGCAEGVFTEMLAPHCKNLLAIDISELAVERAKARLRDLAHVSILRESLPMEMLSGQYDLIICSDVLYYLPKDVLIEFVSRVKGALRPGGVLLALHYLGNFGQAMRGNDVHEILTERSGLDTTHDEIVADVGPTAAGYRVSHFQTPS